MINNAFQDVNDGVGYIDDVTITLTNVTNPSDNEFMADVVIPTSRRRLDANGFIVVTYTTSS